jgi:hypothetical protein
LQDDCARQTQKKRLAGGSLFSDTLAMKKMFHFAAALMISGLFSAHAAEPGKSQKLTSPDQVPEGLSQSDWQSIREAYSTSLNAQAAGAINQQAYLKAPNKDKEDRFGSSVAISGDTVVVGAYGEDSNAKGVNGNLTDNSAIDSGAVYVFVRSDGSWTQQAYLKASNTGANDLFGASVAISGNTIVVGAFGESSNAVGVNGNEDSNSANEAGAAYVFIRSGGSWTQQAYLKSSNTDANDFFGISVAISLDTIVVGASSESSSAMGVGGDQTNNNATSSGAAYVFTRSGSSWNQQAYIKASNTETGDRFGSSLSVSGDTIVVGAEFESSDALGVNGDQTNNSAFRSGAAYVFTRSGISWTQQAYLKASNTDEGDNFGNSVAISGDTVVVGARYESSNAVGVNGNQADDSASQSGAAYVFTRIGTNWTQQAYLKASNTNIADAFGFSVAVSGNTIVVGAFLESNNAMGVNGDQGNDDFTSSGAAYVFTRSGLSWVQQAYLKASNTDKGDIFGVSVAVSGDTLLIGANGEDSNASGVNGNQLNNTTTDSGAAYAFVLPTPESPTVKPPAVVKYQVNVKVKKAKFGKVTGAGSFDAGSTVTLKAKAKKGRKFVGWFENKKRISKKKKLTLKMLSMNRSIIAKFQ